MLKHIVTCCLMSFLSLSLIACVTPVAPKGSRFQYISTLQKSHLEQGKRYFEEGYYRRAMHELLPLACDGNAEAQYAVGYMYYYGYGVAQDTDVGYFWIKRSADQKFSSARQALSLIDKEKDESFRKQALLKG